MAEPLYVAPQNQVALCVVGGACDLLEEAEHRS